MSANSETRRQEILGLQPALMQSAVRLTGDDNEAHDLVHLTMIEALALDASGDAAGGDTRAWMFGLLRSTFHSVARRRVARQERGYHAVQRQLDRDAVLSLAVEQ
ncbi:MAG TPA: sigma factor [Caulobacteraceae bacterium]|nr:sigma factor [Caulobacteraceae bacterium]